MSPMSRVLVLCYHAVSDTWDAELSVTPRSLRRQLAALTSQVWVGTTFTEAVTRPPTPKTMAVTFDDAFDSVRTRAAPLLADLGIPATVFVPTDWPGRIMRWPGIGHWAGTAYADELAAMSWDDLRALSGLGWEIGAHTCSHVHLPRLDCAAIQRELTESRAVCEAEIGRPCRSVAYPFGEADERVLRAASTAGFEAAAGLSSGAFVSPSRFAWPRVGVWHGEPDWRFRLKVSPLRFRPRTRRVLSAVTRRVHAPSGSGPRQS
jgi:peptidoglycan/xylan/chitin deacetylase (PgdA/CDA1 family)